MSIIINGNTPYRYDKYKSREKINHNRKEKENNEVAENKTDTYEKSSTPSDINDDVEKIKDFYKEYHKQDPDKEKEDSINNYLDESKNTINKFKEIAENAPLTAKQELLNAIIKRIQLLHGEAYTAESWRKLMKAYKKGLALSSEGKPKISKLNEVISELNAAISGLELAENENDSGSTEEKNALEMEAALKNQNNISQKANTEKIAAQTTAADIGEANAISTE